MRKRSLLLFAAGVPLLVAASMPGLAQVITTAAVEGDPVAGVGNLTRIDIVAINDSGDWFVEADTDNSDTTADSVLLLTGALYLREGDPLPLPVGATLGSFDSVTINGTGDGGFNFFLDGPPSNADSGIYFNTTLVIQESDISTAPGFSAGTPYIGFFDVKINGAGDLFTVASVDDPAISSSVDRGLVILDLDGSGSLLSESVLFKEADVLPGQTEAVTDFGTGPHQTDFNDAGQVMFFADLTGATSTDGVIYIDNALIAQEGGPSSVPGRNYEFLSSRSLDLNNGGGYVHKANLDGSTSDDESIVVNGTVFIREGDSLPAIGAFSFTSFGSTSGPVKIDDTGNVLWYGDWNDPDTNVDTGLFLNTQLLVQEGVTMIDGLIVDTIANGTDAFAMSDNGQFIIFEATLEGGINGAFLINIGGGNVAPIARCQDVTVVADPATCLADADVDDGSFDPNGDPITLEQTPAGPYTAGVTMVTLTVTDDQGESDSCTATVTVLDETAPEISLDLSPPLLWPPNHRLVDVDAAVVATDACGNPAVTLVSLVSSEPDNAEGDGNTVNDIQGADLGTADFAFRLRAERQGTGSGRVYTATYTATDGAGNETTVSDIVVVPHDQGGETEPVLLDFDGTSGPMVAVWRSAPGALYYNLIRGNLEQVTETAAEIDLGAVTCVAQTPETTGFVDTESPASGEAFFYVIEYSDGWGDTGYGTVSAPKPRVVASGDCD